MIMKDSVECTIDMDCNIYVVRQIRMDVNLKLSCVKLKFESEMRQINLSIVHQFEIEFTILVIEEENTYLENSKNFFIFFLFYVQI